MSKRRHLGVAVLLLVGAGLALWVVGRGLATTERGAAGQRRIASPVETFGIAILLSGIAVIAVRGWGRRILGLAILGLAVGAGIAGSRPEDAGWRDTAVFVLVILVLHVGVVVFLLGPEWPGMASRYDAPSAPKEPGEREMWEALDRGEDPTAG